MGKVDRRIGIAMVALLLLMSIVGAGGSCLGALERMTSDDFDSCVPGAVPAWFDSVQGDAIVAEHLGDELGAPNYLWVRGGASLEKSIDPISGRGSIEFLLKPRGSASNTLVQICDSSTPGQTKDLIFLCTVAGRVKIFDGGELVDLISDLDPVWYTIRLNLDISGQRYDAYAYDPQGDFIGFVGNARFRHEDVEQADLLLLKSMSGGDDGFFVDEIMIREESITMASELMEGEAKVSGDVLVGEYGPRMAFAHIMASPPMYEATVEGYKREIMDAVLAGIDGFLIDEFDWKMLADQPRNTRLMVQAIEELGVDFKFWFCFDIPSGEHWREPGDVVEALKEFADHPSYFRVGDKIVFSSWLGQQRGMQFWNEVIQSLSDAGISVLYVPYYGHEYTNPPALEFLLKRHWSIIDGMYEWDAGCLRSSQWNEDAVILREYGRVFMGCMFPAFFTLPCRRDYCVYIELEGGAGLEERWMRVINVTQPDWMSMGTWNDLLEDHHWSPAVNPPLSDWNPQIPVFTHRGYTELNRYYLDWWKTGRKPDITRDGVFFFYRTHPADMAPPAKDQFVEWGRTMTSHKDPQDVLYVTTMLTEPATLRIVSGTEAFSFDMAAGINHVTVPFSLGQQVFELWRGDSRIVRAVGRHEITDTLDTRNYRMYGDFAYAE